MRTTSSYPGDCLAKSIWLKALSRKGRPITPTTARVNKIKILVEQWAAEDEAAENRLGGLIKIKFQACLIHARTHLAGASLSAAASAKHL